MRGPHRLVLAATMALALGACAAQQEKPTSAAEPAERITSIPSSFDAAALMGMDGDNVARLLGSPGLLRHDGPAQIWQYVDQSCILDLFLYSSGGRYLIEYTEARATRLDATTHPSVQSCLDSILADRRPLVS